MPPRQRPSQHLDWEADLTAGEVWATSASPRGFRGRAGSLNQTGRRWWTDWWWYCDLMVTGVAPVSMCCSGGHRWSSKSSYWCLFGATRNLEDAQAHLSHDNMLAEVGNGRSGENRRVLRRTLTKSNDKYPEIEPILAQLIPPGWSCRWCASPGVLVELRGGFNQWL
jgi:hypothetical protein